MKWQRQPVSEKPQLVFRLIFPRAYLALPRPLDRDTPLTVRLPMRPQGGATELCVIYCSLPPNQFLVGPNLHPAYQVMRLKSGGWVYLVARAFEGFVLPPEVKFPMQLPWSSVRSPDTMSEPADGYMHIYCDPTHDAGATAIEINGLTLHPPQRPA